MARRHAVPRWQQGLWPMTVWVPPGGGAMKAAAPATTASACGHQAAKRSRQGVEHTQPTCRSRLDNGIRHERQRASPWGPMSGLQGSVASGRLLQTMSESWSASSSVRRWTHCTRRGSCTPLARVLPVRLCASASQGSGWAYQTCKQVPHGFPLCETGRFVLVGSGCHSVRL